MYDKDEMYQDIKEMLLFISAFTEPNTQGAEILKQWQDKYLIRK